MSAIEAVRGSAPHGSAPAPSPRTALPAAHEIAGYRPDIDGLRAIAVLAVVAFHAFPASLPGGFVGVDVFFVISGFLISGIILKGLDRGTFTLGDFYARRIRRIFPALIVVLAVSLVCGWLVLLATEYRQLGWHAAAGALFFANFAFWNEAGYFDTAAELKPLLHLWSLGVEEQYYLTWPLLLAFASRRRVSVLAVIGVVGGASFLVNVATVSQYPSAAFYLPFGRMWELALGALIAARPGWGRSAPRSVRELMSAFGLVLVLAACVGLSAARAYPGWWSLLPTLGTALSIAAGPGVWVNRTLLAWRGAVAIGLISYPLYLWHWPLLSFARSVRLEPLDALTTLLLVGLSVFLAWLTYVLIECPIRFGRALSPAWRTPVLLAGMVAILAAGIGAMYDGFSTRLDRQSPMLSWLSTYTYEYREGYRGATCHLGLGQTERDFVPSCVDAGFTDPGRTSILIWGSSHAAHLYPGLRSYADERHLALAQFTTDGCKPAEDPYPDFYPEFCGRIGRFVLERVHELRPDIVVLGAVWEDPDLPRLTRTIAALHEQGAREVIVLGPIPTGVGLGPRGLVTYMRKHSLSAPPERIMDGLNAGPFQVDARMREALAGSDPRYVSAIAEACQADGCLTMSEGQPMSWDGGHLTEAGSRVFARAILAAAGR